MIFETDFDPDLTDQFGFRIQASTRWSGSALFLPLDITENKEKQAV